MKILSLGVILLAITYVELRELPDYITPCHTSDPKYNDCIKILLDKLRQQLIKGIPELDVPSLDPLYLDDLKLFDSTSNDGFQVNLKNIIVTGGGNFKITKLRSLENGTKFDINIFLPQFQATGHYELNGKILSLPLKGNGNFRSNFTNYVANVKLQSEKVNDNGVERYMTKKMVIKVKGESGNVYLENLFNGDKTLADIINKTYNDNFHQIAEVLNPPIERALEKKFKTIGNKFLQQFTYDQLFPV